MRLILEYGPLVLGAILTALAGAAARWARDRAWLRDFLARLLVERRAVVMEVEQVYVDATIRARAANSPGGAELTQEEQREALDLAVARLTELLGLAALDRALRLLGLPRVPAFVRRYLTTQIEASVKELSIEQAAASRGAPPLPPPLPPPLRPTR
jgi:hypothetical protein